MISIDRNSEVALYEQIYNCVSKDIVEGAFKQGDLLPSIRELAQELQVSLITVVNAYQALQADGYIYSQKGKGYFVGADTVMSSNMEEIDETFDKKIDLSVSSTPMELFPWKKWRKYMNAAFDRLEMEDKMLSLKYEKRVLQESLGRYLKAYRGIHVKPEQIVVCSGTLCSVEKLARILTSMENGIAFAEPVSAKIRNVFRANDFRVRPISISREHLEIRELEKNGCTSVFLPAELVRGKTSGRNFLNDILFWMKERKAYLVEYDMGLNELMDIPENGLKENIICIGTFDEILPPEIQCAYLVLPQNLMQRYENMYGRFEPMFPMSYQIALAHFLDDGHLFKMMRKVSYHNAIIEKKNIQLADEYLQDRYELYSDRFMESGLSIRLIGCNNQKEFLERLQEKGIYLIGAKENWYYRDRAREDVFIMKYGNYSEKRCGICFSQLGYVLRR